MGSQISKDFIDQLVDKVDLVELISSRISVKKRGANYLACCPFHEEKTPSFHINPNKQFYYCFGCAASGDAITFLIEHDKLSFVEAVEELGDGLGMDIPKAVNSGSSAVVEWGNSHNGAPKPVSILPQLFELLSRVAKFYHWNLRQGSEGAMAIEYLKSRGISGEIAKRYQIGWVGINQVKSRFMDKSMEVIAGRDKSEVTIDFSLLDKSGLVMRSDAREYDRFRQRIMFPIRDKRGRVLGFGGRVIDPGNNPKYLNSPETMIFSKSKVLYGLYEAMQACKNFPCICVV